MTEPGRQFSLANYRYGFNGKENDPETNTQDYGFRIYDPRLGKFLSVDPLTQKFPELTPYQFASNTPIKAVDIDGLETSWRPPGQLGPREDEYKFGSQSTCQGCTVNKELYAPPPPPQPATVRAGPAPTEAQKAATAKYVTWRDANGGYDDSYNLNKIKRENIEIVENSPINFFPIIGSLKRAGKYELMGMHSEAGGALKDAAVEVALGYGINKAIGVGFRYLNGSTFYRSMSNEGSKMFIRTGRMPAGTETFISPTKSVAENYGGTLFKIKVSSGTVSQLESIGVRNAAAGHPFGNLPLVSNGWKSTNAFFKLEGTQVNIGLGNGNALNIFNSNIKSFKVIK